MTMTLRNGAAEIPIPETVKWPVPIDEAAYYGLAGDIVRTLEPQTEADPVALLIHVLVGVGRRIAVYTMLEQGIIPAIRLGRRWIVTRHPSKTGSTPAGCRLDFNGKPSIR